MEDLLAPWQWMMPGSPIGRQASKRVLAGLHSSWQVVQESEGKSGHRVTGDFGKHLQVVWRYWAREKKRGSKISGLSVDAIGLSYPSPVNPVLL